MSGRRPEGNADHPDVHQFGKWLEAQVEPSYDTTSGKRNDDHDGFVPNSCIQNFFKRDISSLTRVLLAIFDKSDPRELSVDPAEVAAYCPRVFCILFSIGRGTWIRIFIQHAGLYDDNLPFYTNPPDFPSDPECPEFFSKFYDRQWRFCAPTMMHVSTMNIRKELVLPFITLENKRGGGSGNVYKVRVHEAHDDLIPSGASSPGRNVPPHVGHLYAVKTYRRGNAQADYQREVTAFRQLTEGGARSTPGIVQFYCGFVYKDSFNIILEFADMGNLEEYFRTQGEPSTPEDVMLFWSSLLELTKALLTIHNRRYNRYGSGDGIIRKGWHQDLKPKNILVFSNDSPSVHGYTFKVCDLSLAHFKTAVEGVATDATDYDSFGTTTYGAPECHPSSEFSAFHGNLIGNGVDIWSLGCIFSESAVWVVKGLPGLLQYREQRRTAVRPDLEFTGGDCFHDGARRLAEVDNEHRKLRQGVINPDFITIPVVDSLVDDMLQEKPNLRYTAKQVEAKAQRLLSQARTLLREHSESQDRARPQPAGEPQVEAGVGSSSLSDSQEQDNAAWNRSIHHSNHFDQHRSFENGQDPFINGLAFTRNALPQASQNTGSGIQPSAMNHAALVEQRGERPVQAHENIHPQRQSTISHKSKKRELPMCTREQAKTWCIKMHNGSTAAELPSHHLMKRLKKRDFVLIVDDSATMKEYWKDVEDLVKTLGYITKRMDPDGIEFYTLKDDKRRTSKSSETLAGWVRALKPQGTTSLNWILEQQLKDYGDRIEKSTGHSLGFLRRPPRKRAIYILTDGILSDGTQSQGHAAIEHLVARLSKASCFRSQIGVQLISFGNNEQGLQRLKALDNLKKTHSLPLDIVDTEPSDGNVWKMLLGAIDDGFDEVDSDNDLNQPGPSSRPG